jgi:hypothetical protein
VAGDQDVAETHQAGDGVVLEEVFVAVVFEKQAVFFLVDVHSEVADVSGLQPLHHGGGLHQASPAGIDQHHAALHFPDACGVDQVVGVFVQGEE